MIPTMTRAWLAFLFVVLATNSPAMPQTRLVIVARTGERAGGSDQARFDTIGRPALNRAGEVAFWARLKHAGITGDADESIWFGSPGSIAAIASEGAEAPGLPSGIRFGCNPHGYTYVFSDRPLLNDAGDVAFLANVTGTVPRARGIWVGRPGTLRLITWTGDRPPGTQTGQTFDAFDQLKLNATGEVAFHGRLSGSSTTATNDSGLWAGAPGSLAMVASKAPDLFVDVSDHPGFSGLSINAAGRVAFRGQFKPIVSGNTVTFNYGLWVGRPGPLLIVRRGDVARGGMTFEYLGEPVFNGPGDLAFSSSDSNTPDSNSAIYIIRQGQKAVVAVEGVHATATPVGVLWGDLTTAGPAALNDAGELVFAASLKGSAVTSSNDAAIWAGTRESLKLVARKGDQAPGAPQTVFMSFGELQLNAKGDVAFYAALGGNGTRGTDDHGIWVSRSGQLTLVARKGDLYGVLPGLVRTVTSVGDFAFNDSGQTAFLARFDDGSVGLVLVTP